MVKICRFQPLSSTKVFEVPLREMKESVDMAQDQKLIDLGLIALSEEELKMGIYPQEVLWFLKSPEGLILGPYQELQLQEFTKKHRSLINEYQACHALEKKWLGISEHGPFKEEDFINPEFKEKEQPVSTSGMTYKVLVDGVVHGPYLKQDVVKKIKDHEFRLHDMIKRRDEPEWTRVCDHADFEKNSELTNQSLPFAPDDKTFSKAKISVIKELENRQNSTSTSDILVGLMLSGQEKDFTEVKEVPHKELKAEIIEEDLPPPTNNDFSEMPLPNHPAKKPGSFKKFALVGVGLFLVVFLGKTIMDSQSVPSKAPQKTANKKRAPKVNKRPARRAISSSRRQISSPVRRKFSRSRSVPRKEVKKVRARRAPAAVTKNKNVEQVRDEYADAELIEETMDDNDRDIAADDEDDYDKEQDNFDAADESDPDENAEAIIDKLNLEAEEKAEEDDSDGFEEDDAGEPADAMPISAEPAEDDY